MSQLIVPGVAFAIASSPETFKLMRRVAGNWVSSAEGVATPAGLFLHTLFFLLVLWLTGKYLPRLLPMASGFEHRKACENSSNGVSCARDDNKMWYYMKNNSKIYA
jgi:uncharacterized membrane protein YhiD involved in acid resistance